VYKHILIPTDGSKLAATAVKRGVEFAKEIGAKVTGITVTEPFHLLSVAPSQLEYNRAGFEAHAETFANKALGEISATAMAAGVPCRTVRVEHEHPYQGIIDAAAENGCDLIVMASHGRSGMAATVLGSQTIKILSHSKVPVLVHR
jgi:nucleotide-binding universal stress UspA family protein